MKTTIYWAIRHWCSAVHEFRIRAACWWLDQQVEFLDWRMRLESVMSPEPSTPAPVSAGQEGQYAVRSM